MRVATLELNPRAEAIQRQFEKPLIVAAVLSIPTTILQFSSIGEPWQTLGEILNWLIWLAFLAELGAMLAVARALALPADLVGEVQRHHGRALDRHEPLELTPAGDVDAL
jgi:hypothetical protein